MTQLPLIWTVLSKSFVNVATREKYSAAVLSQAARHRSHSSLDFGDIFCCFSTEPADSCELLGCPSLPTTDRGRMTARDRPRYTSASGAALSSAPAHSGATPRYLIGLPSCSPASVIGRSPMTQPCHFKSRPLRWGRMMIKKE